MKDRYYFAYGSNMNLEQMKSQKRVRRVWIFMKDSQVFMGKNRFG